MHSFFELADVKKQKTQPPELLTESLAAKIILDESATEFLKKLRTLYDAIDKMNAYGIDLERQGAAKGRTVRYAAADIARLVVAFFGENGKLREKPPENDNKSDWSTKNNAEFGELKTAVTQKFATYDPQLKEYRLALNTIAKNILFALTIVGAILIAGKSAFTKIRKNRAEYFFGGEDGKTTSEKLANKVKRELNNIPFLSVKRTSRP